MRRSTITFDPVLMTQKDLLKELRKVQGLSSRMTLKLTNLRPLTKMRVMDLQTLASDLSNLAWELEWGLHFLGKARFGPSQPESYDSPTSNAATTSGSSTTKSSQPP